MSSIKGGILVVINDQAKDSLNFNILGSWSVCSLLQIVAFCKKQIKTILEENGVEGIMEDLEEYEEAL